MTDSVFPQTVLAPAIAVIGAHDNRCVRESGQKWSEQRVHVFEACALSRPTLGGAIHRLIRLAGIIVCRPGRAFKVVRYVRFANIQKGEHRVQCSTIKLARQPMELARKRGSSPWKKEGFEITRELVPHSGRGIEPSNCCRTKCAVTEPPKSLNDRCPFKKEDFTTSAPVGRRPKPK